MAQPQKSNDIDAVEARIVALNASRDSNDAALCLADLKAHLADAPPRSDRFRLLNLRVKLRLFLAQASAPETAQEHLQKALDDLETTSDLAATPLEQAHVAKASGTRAAIASQFAPLSDAAALLERAIPHLVNAHQLYQSADNAKLALETLATLGTVQAMFSQFAKDEDRFELLRQSRDTAVQALEIAEATLPVEHTTTQLFNCANAMLDLGKTRSGAAASTDLTAALAYYKRAGATTSKDKDPRMTALIATNAASTHSLRAQILTGPDALSDLSDALRLFQDAIDALPQEQDPLSFATTQLNMASTLITRSDHVSRLEALADLARAIDGFDLAAQVQSPDAAPHGYARICVNRALAHARMADHTNGHTAVGHLDKALESYREAERIRTRKDDAFNWAETQNGVAVTYIRRVDFMPRDVAITEVQRAVTALEGALEVYDPTVSASWYTKTRMTLGIALTSLAQLQPDQSEALLEQSIAHHDAALALRLSDASPRSHATSQINRADAFQKRAHLCPNLHAIDDLEQAAVGYRAALVGFSKDHEPNTHAMVQRFLAQVLLSHADQVPPAQRQPLLQEARDALRAAQLLLDSRLRGKDWIEVTLDLAATEAKAGDPKAQGALLDMALSDGRARVLTTEDALERSAILRRLTGTGDDLAMLCLNSGDIEGALQAIGRARGIRASIDHSLNRVMRDPALGDLARARKAVQASERKLDQVLAGKAGLRTQTSRAEPGSDDATVLSLRMTELDDRERDARQTLEQAQQDFTAALHAAGLESADVTPDLATLHASVPSGQALVILVIATTGTAALILARTPTGQTCDPMSVSVSDMTAKDLDALVLGGEDAQVPGWMDVYRRYHSALAPRTQSDQGARALHLDDPAYSQLDLSLRRISNTLWDRLLGPVDAALAGLGAGGSGWDEITLMPPGRLAALPLGIAAPQGDGPMLLENWALSLSMSPQAFVATGQALSGADGLNQGGQGEARWGGDVLAVTDPLGDLGLGSDLDGVDLRNPALDVTEAEHCHELRGPDATLGAVIAALPDMRYASFFCHGQWDPDDPARSGLLMAGADGAPDLLTVADLNTVAFTPPGPRLWVLGACETAPLSQTEPDEFVGLAAGLSIDVPGVMATLFPVTTFSTDLLARAVLAAHRHAGLSPALALAQAQRIVLRQGPEALEAWVAAHLARAEVTPEVGVQAAVPTPAPVSAPASVAAPAPILTPIPVSAPAPAPMAKVALSPPTSSVMFGAARTGLQGPAEPANPAQPDWPFWLSHWAGFVLIGR